MSRQTYSGYPGVYPNPNNQGSSTPSQQEGTVISETADSKLVRSPDGTLIITDKNGNRRG